VLLGLRAAPRDNTGVSAAELVYGTQLVLPGQCISSPAALEPLLDDVRAAVTGFGPVPTLHAGPAVDRPVSPPEELLSADYVLVRTDGAKPPLARPYEGPYRVLQRSNQCFKLQVGNTQQVVSTSRLKPVRSSEVVEVARPRSRGQPKKCVSFSLP
jgi:hypothetical protein